MSRHHLKNATLAEYAAGTLDEGRSLVVATHLTLCRQCNDFVSALEAVGGQLLEQIEPVAMADGAAAQALSHLAREPAGSGDALNKGSRKPIVWQPEQNRLLGYDLGPWRWISPGLHYRVVKMPAGDDTRVFMLKAVPGLKLPAHRHTGTELTCVLSGAFIHEGGRYAAGDCDDADQDDGHTPVIDEGDECVCLVAMQGQIQFTSMLGRLIQPFIRI
jgi:putative transcriptional regulator